MAIERVRRRCGAKSATLAAETSTLLIRTSEEAVANTIKKSSANRSSD